MDGENILKLNPSPELTVLQSELGSWDNPVSYTHLTLPTNREV